MTTQDNTPSETTGTRRTKLDLNALNLKIIELDNYVYCFTAKVWPMKGLGPDGKEVEMRDREIRMGTRPLSSRPSEEEAQAEAAHINFMTQEIIDDKEEKLIKYLKEVIKDYDD